MPLFQYKAISEKGRKIVDTIDADSLQDAKFKLIKRQIAVLQVGALHEKQIRKSPLSKSELLNLTREIERLLGAGLPLFETLSALEEKYRGQKGHQLLLDLSDLVRSGLSFSQGLAKHPETFDLLYVSMVSNAEKTGRLGPALSELSELLARQLQIQAQIKAALLYPALLSGFCFVVLSSLLFYVIPSLRELFDGRDLHPFTQIVFAASQFACSSKEILAVLALGAITVGIATSFSSSWKRKIFSLSFRLFFSKKLDGKSGLCPVFSRSRNLARGRTSLDSSIFSSTPFDESPDPRKYNRNCRGKNFSRGIDLRYTPRSFFDPPFDSPHDWHCRRRGQTPLYDASNCTNL